MLNKVMARATRPAIVAVAVAFSATRPSVARAQDAPPNREAALEVRKQYVADMDTLQSKFLDLMQSQGEAELSEDDEDELEDAVAFEGVSKYPARVKCALLGWMAMKSAVAEAGWAAGDTAPNDTEQGSTS